MGDKSGIQWTDATWNPTTGCTRVSPGCDHCYAFQLHDQRHISNRESAIEGAMHWIVRGEAVPVVPVATSTICAFAREKGVKLPFPPQYDVPFSQVQVLSEDRLTQPLRWTRGRRIFVDSMSDLFHEDVPDEAIDRVFAVMALTPQHTYQVLTKRPERMREYLSDRETPGRVMHAVYALREPGEAEWGAVARWANFGTPLPNVWLGVSVEDQERADERIPLLLDTPAAVRFLSMEPLLAAVNLDIYTTTYHQIGDAEYLRPTVPEVHGLHWVIAGGESGPHARPFDLAWARSLRDQCQQAGVAFFLKQLGSKPQRRCGHGFAAVGCPGSGGLTSVNLNAAGEGCEGHALRLRNSHGSNADEWPEDLRVREFPRSTVQA